MLDRITEIAPLATWAQVLGAAALLLLGFVGYGHYRVHTQAYLQDAGGLAAATTPASLRRWMLLLLAGGFSLWGLALGWPALATGALAGAALLLLALELLARLRG